MDRFMKVAYEEALSNIQKKEGGPFGAVIVKDHKIIARAHNEVLLRNDPTAHAEVMAIRKACKKLRTFNLEGCELYASSKPCPMCKGAVQWSGIRELYFSGDYDDTDQLNFGDSAFDEDFMRIEQTWHQIDQDSFPEIIRAFSDLKDDVHY